MKFEKTKMLNVLEFFCLHSLISMIWSKYFCILTYPTVPIFSCRLMSPPTFRSGFFAYVDFSPTKGQQHLLVSTKDCGFHPQKKCIQWMSVEWERRGFHWSRWGVWRRRRRRRRLWWRRRWLWWKCITEWKCPHGKRLCARHDGAASAASAAAATTATVSA